ncbi:hypothetical protein ERO13_D08G059401v2 [Gossypium hirsutum]|uniref:Transcription factor CBF/NF-Y/archaeal histone domain-containing protein n=1 Tax=Gossypium darwinii TaxID=34276 RepID=A0A5D2BGF0_GOSDA|nr:hypothetical protein ERO13_D08G059401v2 [Gossypium hirsutum]TYG56454.1 hypothetical protein ES288_D08G064700v1 [Gossypium darwinii]
MDLNNGSISLTEFDQNHHPTNSPLINRKIVHDLLADESGDIANVSRIMKKALPANTKSSKDAKETVQ